MNTTFRTYGEAGSTTGHSREQRGRFDVRTLAGWRRLVQMATWLLVIMIVMRELRRPKEERTWHGTVLGFVPYDLRRPTPARFRDTYWNAESRTLFPGRVFGVGWGLNLYEAQRRLRSLAGAG